MTSDSSAPLRAVLFDLDGTLLNSLADLTASANATLRKFGFPEHDEASYRTRIGDGVESLLRRSFPSDADVDFREASRFYRSYYSENWRVSTTPYSGIPELIETCRSLGLKTAVLSNKIHEFTVKMCSYFFPAEFDFICGVQLGREPKPDPGGAREIFAALQLEPESCAMLGDSDVDMMVAQRADMRGWGAAWGFRGAAELEAAGAERVWESASEIRAWLGA